MLRNTDEERKRTYTVDSNANRFGKKKCIIGGREEVPREREREREVGKAIDDPVFDGERRRK